MLFYSSMTDSDIHYWVDRVESVSGVKPHAIAGERAGRAYEVFQAEARSSLTIDSRFASSAPLPKILEYADKIAVAYFSHLDRLADHDTKFQGAPDGASSAETIRILQDAGRKKLAINVAWNQDALAIREEMKSDPAMQKIITDELFGTVLVRCMDIGRQEFNGLHLNTTGGPRRVTHGEPPPALNGR